MKQLFLICLLAIISINSLAAHPGHGIHEADIFHYAFSFEHLGWLVMGLCIVLSLISQKKFGLRFKK